jgi:A/G-specific adenine glycosylase
VDLPVNRVAVLAWAAAHQRDLPWRRTRDPWAILVSELMLQQTQVARVVPRYHDFVARWPTARACADAGAAEVVRSWAGLGYNRRAIRLQAAASVVAYELGGVFPRDLPGLQRLPGIGPYTARAVAAFAYEDDVAVVDTNVARVLARVGGAALSPKQVQAAADAIVPPGTGWAWNQAMLDVGALLCRPRAPRCEDCPMATSCRWWQAGRPAPDPAVGSAHVSTPQARFAGSDREVRGRLVAALRAGPVSRPEWAAATGCTDAARVQRLAMALVADGLAVLAADQLRLPEGP